MKEWRLLLDGRSISLTFLLLFQKLRNHVFDHFLVSTMNSNDQNISAEDWGYNYFQHVHLRMYSNMYQLSKNVKIHVSQNLKIPAYELFDKFKVSYTINTFIWTVQCIFIWAKLSSSSTLYLSTLLLFIIIIFDNFEHCLSTSQKKSNHVLPWWRRKGLRPRKRSLTCKRDESED